MAVATPRGPKRNAAHNNKGIVMCPHGLFDCWTNRCEYMVMESSDKEKSNNAASAIRSGDHRPNGVSVQVNINGVTTRAPTASPSHHVNHNPAKFAHVSAPPRHKLILPIVALMAVLIIAAKPMNFKRSIARLKGLWAAPNRRSRKTAETASRVLPTAIPPAVAKETSVKK